MSVLEVCVTVLLLDNKMLPMRMGSTVDHGNMVSTWQRLWLWRLLEMPQENQTPGYRTSLHQAFSTFSEGKEPQHPNGHLP